MRKFDDNFNDVDLKCDFPARGSFREALLKRLLVMNEQDPEGASRDDNVLFFENDSDGRELSDSELEMLAAAQGELYVVNNEFLDNLPPR